MLVGGCGLIGHHTPDGSEWETETEMDEKKMSQRTRMLIDGLIVSVSLCGSCTEMLSCVWWLTMMLLIAFDQNHSLRTARLWIVEWQPWFAGGWKCDEG